MDVLVVDDGSRDRTAELARGARSGGAQLPREPRPARGRRGRIRVCGAQALRLLRPGRRGRTASRRRSSTASSTSFAPASATSRSARGSCPATATSRTDTSRARRGGLGQACCVARSSSSSGGRSQMRRAGCTPQPRPHSRSSRSRTRRVRPRSRAFLRLADAGLVVEEIPVNMRERAAGESRISGKKAVSLVLTLTGTILLYRWMKRRP